MIKLAPRTAVVGAIAILGVAVSGCASHRFVRDNVQVVNERVDGVDSHLAQVEGTAGEALARANAAHKLAQGKFLYEVVLSDDSVKFPVNHTELSPEAEQRLAELVQRLRAENANVYLEIQGHTDSTGSEAGNQQLGLQRAEAVRLHLARAGLPLVRMATISYGETAPLADNNTREGRSTNRRVQLIVMR